MIIKKYFIGLITLLFIANARSQDVTISVIIPCNYKHAHHLDNLLNLFEQQTRIPDEVIISLSDSNKVDQKVLDALYNKKCVFPIKLFVTDTIKYPGENRNIGCSNASGDVFVLQDADDIPHPQRIEIIKYFFDNYTIDHLMHKYNTTNSSHEACNFPIYQNFKNISFFKPKNMAEAWDNHITNGNIAISRRVFDKVQWNAEPRGQDTHYNIEISKHFKNQLVVLAPLLCYRIYLTSSKDGALSDISNNKISYDDLFNLIMLHI